MNIAIIGIGLIGGSMAIDLKESGCAKHIIGIDLVEENLNKALRRKIIDEALNLEKGIAKAEVIIIATPVSALLKLLPTILDQVEEQLVLEVGSSKVDILNTVAHHSKRGQLVSIHPMAGTEFSGPEAAVPNLFKNKTCVLVEKTKSALPFLTTTKIILDHLEMNIVEYGAEEHDLHCAYVSHISHISSFALALTVLEKEKDEKRIFELASGGFSSSVRLAKSSANMWVPIFQQNRENIIDVLDEHINSLGKFRSYLIEKDFKAIEQLIHQSNEIKRILR